MLYVNEIYGPVKQGEGPSAGMDCVFLRLSHCNLSCKFCDTPYTWNWIGTDFEHPDKFDKAKEIHSMLPEDVFSTLRLLSMNYSAVVITGGEPLLQWKSLLPLVYEMDECDWHIEVETNGTVWPGRSFVDAVTQINCSPKLANCGNDERDRIKPDVLKRLSASPKTIFKFVIGSEDDLREVHELVDRFDMRNVWLMPLGKTREQLASTSAMVRDMAQTNGWNYSPRLHIELHGDKRGV
jgi:7-carboxy-7-deazaguanine synthase